MIERLFVYGTLAPGQPNEHVLREIGVTWEAATVTVQDCFPIMARPTYPMISWIPETQRYQTYQRETLSPSNPGQDRALASLNEKCCQITKLLLPISTRGSN